MVHPDNEASLLIKQSSIYLQDDDGMLGGVLIQQVLEVGGAGAQDHLVGFGMLALEDFIKLMSRKASIRIRMIFNSIK